MSRATYIAGGMVLAVVVIGAVVYWQDQQTSDAALIQRENTRIDRNVATLDAQSAANTHALTALWHQLVATGSSAAQTYAGTNHG